MCSVYNHPSSNSRWDMYVLRNLKICAEYIRLRNWYIISGKTHCSEML